jgi:ribose-phosphate pyrophosphokinase
MDTLQVYNLIGDVEGKVAILVDDMIDTAGTLSAAAALLRKHVRRLFLSLFLSSPGFGAGVMTIAEEQARWYPE